MLKYHWRLLALDADSVALWLSAIRFLLAESAFVVTTLWKN
jgi:hypothetical protein